MHAGELKLWYLSQVNLVQHHQAGAPVVVDQPPEVLDGVGQRMLGDDEGSGLPVALQESEEGDTSQKTLPPVERRSGVPQNLLTGVFFFFMVTIITISRRHTESRPAWDDGRHVMMFAHITMQ